MDEHQARAVRQPVVRFAGGERIPDEVPVIREVPLTLHYNGREIITLLATPDHLDELAVGFLRSEGFLERREDLVDLRLDAAGGTAEVTGRLDAALVERLLEKRTVTSGCGKGTTFYHALDALQAVEARGDFTVPLEEIIRLTAQINAEAARNRAAGGVHHAALASPGAPPLVREDIGRHNAIDKIQGRCFLDSLPVHDRFLLCTGRISSEILIKASKMGVPLLVSLSKPSALALELARRLKISVVGDLRGNRGIIFADFGRIT